MRPTSFAGERFVVCAVSELPPGARRIVTFGSRSIGVFNVGGRYYALRNACPHQGAPLCEGPLTGTTLPGPPGTFRYGREGEILRCPWHGWEFDVTSGRSIFNPHAVRVRAYPVAVEDADCSADVDCGPDAVRVETYPVSVERRMVVLRGVSGVSRRG
ncbi:MAG: Rieske (2Fe-2S) protein [Spirochaetaceae bacterium]|nr:Rieske (2Fe-2S) protein [Spirochaetaceae bacterium]